MARDEEGSSVQKRVLLRHNQTLRAKLEETKEEYESQLKELRDQLAQNVEAHESETLKKLQAELESAIKRADIANNKMELYAPKLKTLTTEKRELQVEVKSLTDRIAELEVEAKRVEERISEATDELQLELKQTTQRNLELEQALAEEKAAHGQVKSELVRVFSELNQLKTRNAKDLEALQKSEEKIADLQAQIDGMATRYITLGERVDFESNKNQLLNNEIARLKAKLDEKG